MQVSIECIKCGLCCKRAYMIEGFPEPLNEDGSCSHLAADNTCKIYNDRPLICNSQYLYEHFFNKEVSPEQYHRINADACIDLMKEAGMPVPADFGTHYKGIK